VSSGGHAETVEVVVGWMEIVVVGLIVVVEVEEL
jgi:hypothetical protein